MKTISLILLLLLFSSSTVIMADTIFFKDGMRLDVTTVWEEGGQIRCELYGTEVSYPREDVERIEKTSEDVSEPAQATHGDETEAARHHKKALELADTGALIEAIEHEEKALRLNPNDSAITESLVALYRAYAAKLGNKGNKSDAVSYLEQACERDPKNVEVRQELAAAYVSLARETFRERDYYATNELLNKAKRNDDENPSIFVLSGETAYLNNNYTQAEEDWIRSLSIDSEQPRVIALLAKMRQERSAERGFVSERRADFQFKFEHERQDDVAEASIVVLEEAYEKVGNDLVLFPDWVIQVIIYPRSGLKELQYFPDWAAGVYDGKIRIGEDLFERSTFMKAVLFHEYTHVLVRALGGASVPLWLNEGLAEYESQQYRTMRVYRRRLLIKAAKMDKLFTLDQLARINLSRLPYVAIELVYAQSESFVTYLIEEHASLGEMREILTRLKDGEPIEDAVRTVLYKELAELEEEWRRDLVGDGE